jgi:ring-1,2-phenylacetyl-CoA epoxidase subunit PaaE
VRAASRSIISKRTETLSVESVRFTTRDAIVVSFDVPAELRERFRFTQGQFLTLEADVDGEPVRRSYSICAAPSENALRVAIKRTPGGLFSTWAHESLVPGARVRVAPPDGRFHVTHDPAQRKHYLAFAAGSGITPIISILRHVLETEPLSRCTLVYGNRSSSNVMFRDELQDLKDRYIGRLTLLFVMSREAQDVELFSGRIDREKCDALFASWIDPATVDVAFVCGPQAMTESVTSSLEAHGIAKDRIKTELFAAAPRNGERPPVRATATESDLCEAYAILDGQRRSFTIERGKESVLEAGLRQGLDLPYSCKGGVCSTCRVILVEGEVDMDVHYALEDYEIARGFILMCQSFPATERIGIDVDAHSHV